MARTQNNLGLLYYTINDYSTALTAYSTALEIYESFAKNNLDFDEKEMCRSMVMLGWLQKVNYQSTRQTQINSYLEKVKQILSKYSDIPLSKTLMKDVIDLEEYFKNRELLSPIQALQNKLEQKAKYAEKIILRRQIIDEYRYIVTNGNPQFANKLGSSLSSLAWYQLFEKQFKVAEQSVREALNPTTFKKIEGYDTKIEWVNTNLALALLFQGKYAEAEKIYVSLKDKPYNNATYRETFLADLEELEKAGITHPDVVKIRELLKK